MAEYKLEPMDEKRIMEMEEKIYAHLCGNYLTGEVASWLSILHSHVMRLINRLHEIENGTNAASSTPRDR